MPETGDGGGSMGGGAGKNATGGETPAASGGDKQSGSSASRAGEAGASSRGAAGGKGARFGDAAGATKQGARASSGREGQESRSGKSGSKAAGREGAEGKTIRPGKKDASQKAVGEQVGSKKISTKETAGEAGEKRAGKPTKAKEGQTEGTKEGKSTAKREGQRATQGDGARKSSESKQIRTKTPKEGKSTTRSGSDKAKSKELKSGKTKEGQEKRNGKSKKEGSGKKDESLPDISDTHTYSEVSRGSNVKKIGFGYLGKPGEVQTHRNSNEQQKLCGGTGDHAGHGLSNDHGATGDRVNLHPHNSRLNLGVEKSLQNYQTRHLKDGYKIRELVVHTYRKGENRPFAFKHRYHIYKDGKLVKSGELLCANTHTPKSREMQGIKDQVSNQKDNVINAAHRFGANRSNVVQINRAESARGGGLKKAAGEAHAGAKQIRAADGAQKDQASSQKDSSGRDKVVEIQSAQSARARSGRVNKQGESKGSAKQIRQSDRSLAARKQLEVGRKEIKKTNEENPDQLKKDERREAKKKPGSKKPRDEKDD